MINSAAERLFNDSVIGVNNRLNLFPVHIQRTAANMVVLKQTLRL